MSSVFRCLLATFIALTFLTPTALAQAGGAPVPLRPEAAAALADLERSGADLRPTISPRTGLVTFLRSPSGGVVPTGASGDAEVRARAFLDRHGALFGLAREDGLQLKRASDIDAVGMEHVRFRQTWKGIPVAGGEVSVHLVGDGVAAVHAKTIPQPAELDLVREISAEAAEERVRESLARSGSQEGLVLSEPRLEILDRGHLGGPPFPARLAWFIEARRIDLREYLWVDARTGIVLLRFSQLTDARDRKVYDGNDPDDGLYDDLPGNLVREEGDGPVAAGDHASDANDAYDYAGDTYDYFLSEHGRDSYDGAGAAIVSTVHFCPDSFDCPFANAFWNGEQMVYGEGFPAADDVDAHELTHAVTEHSANLFYYMQSGALNESFSDIFGEAVDLVNGSGTDTAGVRWLLGEDVPGFGAIRDMMDPTSFGDPGKMSDPGFVCATPGGDGGGVHSNSGVPNHAFALMVDGGSYNGLTVTGLGLVKAAKVQYRALNHYLLSASNFLDNYNALLQSCDDLVGTAGITVADCAEVRDALDAVEMGDPLPCATAAAAAPALCAPGQTVTDLFYDDFEELPGAGLPGQMNAAELTHWTQEILVQPATFTAGNAHFGDVCCLGPFATSGAGNAWGYDVGATGDSALEMVSDVTVPLAGARAQFSHSYGFENNGATLYDGGVLEISTNGGVTWVDAGGFITAGRGYDGTLSSGFSNPLGGRPAFGGDTHGFTGSQLDLSNFSTLDVRFRFRIGTDEVVDDFGWFIDDFRIYTCAGGDCSPSVVLANQSVNVVATEIACTLITAGNDGTGDYVVAGGGDLTLQAPTVVLRDGFRVESGGRLTIANAAGP